jgi:hypothetical protein
VVLRPLQGRPGAEGAGAAHTHDEREREKKKVSG